MTDRPSIVEFLRARLDEDDRSARWMDHFNIDDGGYYSCPAVHTEPYGDDLPWGEDACDCHLEKHRKRALAEVEAKRWILDTLVPEVEDMDETIHQQFCGATYPDAHHYITVALLRQMALLYADHPDYDPDWAPDKAVT